MADSGNIRETSAGATALSIASPLAGPIYQGGGLEEMSAGEAIGSFFMPVGFGGTMNARRQAAEQAAAAENTRQNQIAMGQGSLQRGLELTDLSNAAISQGANKALGQSAQGTQLGLQSLYGGNQDAQSALLQGQAQGQQRLSSTGAQFRQDMAPLTGLQSYGQQAGANTQAYDLLSRQSNRTQALLDNPSSLQQDPGYQFRLQQGEQSINRANAARGGRAGGRAMKELSQFSQGLASQEFGNAFQRASAADAAELQALANQAGRQDAATLADRQRQLGLANVGYGAQGNLAAGMMGLGQQRANLDIATQQQIAQNALGTGQAAAGMHQAQGNLAAGIYAGAGQQQAQNYQNQANRDVSLTQTLIPQQTEVNKTAGGDQGARAAGQENVLGIAGSILGMFSDERVKENIEDASAQVDAFLDEIEPKSFDYIDPCFGGSDMIGVMAQDVQRSDIGKTLVSKDPTSGALQLDIRRTLSLCMASVARLAKRMRQQEATQAEINIKLDAILDAMKGAD